MTQVTATSLNEPDGAKPKTPLSGLDRWTADTEVYARHKLASGIAAPLWAAPLGVSLLAPFGAYGALLAMRHEEALGWLAGSIVAFWLLCLQVRLQAGPLLGRRPGVDRLLPLLPALGAPGLVFSYAAWAWLDLSPADLARAVIVVTGWQAVAATVAGVLWSTCYSAPPPRISPVQGPVGLPVRRDGKQSFDAYLELYINEDRDLAVEVGQAIPAALALFGFVPVLLGQSRQDISLVHWGFGAGLAGYWLLILEIWLIALLKGRAGLRPKLGALLYTTMIAAGLPGLYLASLLAFEPTAQPQAASAALSATVLQSAVALVGLLAWFVVHRPPRADLGVTQP